MSINVPPFNFLFLIVTKSKNTDLVDPLVPKGIGGHQEILFYLQIQPWKVNLNLNCGFLLFAPSALMG